MTDLDQRLLEALSRLRKPATGNYLAKKLNEPVDAVSQHLAQLAPLVRREAHVIRDRSDQPYQVWAYSLAQPELVAARIFGSKTCPKGTTLNTIE
jgi:hypothetical protein